MRSALGLLLLAGCSAGPPTSAVAPAENQPRASSAAKLPPSVEQAPQEEPPPEPARMIAVQGPKQSACVVTGELGDVAIELAAESGAEPFASLAIGSAAFSFGEDGSAFAEVRLPTGGTLRGYTSRTFLDAGVKVKVAALVYATRWVSFGGVYYPGAHSLRVLGVRGSSLIVTPHLESNAGFTLEANARTLELPCAELSLEPKAGSEIHRAPPPAFTSASKPEFNWLTGAGPVPLSSTAADPPSGALTPSAEQPLQVVVLERKGKRARVRYRHVAGWIDAARLTAKEPKVAHDRMGELARALDAVGDDADVLGAGQKHVTERVACSSAVRLVAEQGGERFLVGSLPPAHAFRIGERTPELAYLVLEFLGLRARGARLAIPARDAVGCTYDAKVPLVFELWNPLREQRALERDERDAVTGLESAPKPTGDQSGVIGYIEGGDSVELRAAKMQDPKLLIGAASVSGKLPVSDIARILQRNHAKFHLCYLHGLIRDPKLRGKLSARFSINAQGKVGEVSSRGASLPDEAVVQCVERVLKSQTFPSAETGTTGVVVPMTFLPR